MKVFLFVFLFIGINLFASTSPLEKVTLQLQWKYQFQFAGFIMAKELGYYEANGLDVSFVELQNGVDSLATLEKGKADFALSNFNIPYKNKKLHDVTLIATYFQRSPLVLITQKEIHSVLDLKGKRIMLELNDRFNSSITNLLYFFNINEVNTHIVSPSYNIQDFIDKKVDATTAFTSNELFELEKKHVAFHTIDPITYGFTTSANNLFTRQDKIANNPQQVNAFLSATKKGWDYALNNIEKTAQIIQQKYAPQKSLEKLIFEARATREIMLLNLYEVGHVNKEFVYQEFKRLKQQGKLSKEEKTDELILDDSEIQLWIEQGHKEKAKKEQSRIIMIFLLLLLAVILIWSLRMHTEIHKRRLAEEKLFHQANHDILTDLPNRALFIDRLSQAIKHADRHKEHIALFFIDLDNFKKINDTYGHQVGDSYLQEVASKLQAATRQTDTVARIGGDEFVIIQGGFNKYIIPELNVKNLYKAFEEIVTIDTYDFNISLSIGIALYPQDASTTDELIKNADTAMYEAKDTGRNQYKFFSKNAQ